MNFLNLNTTKKIIGGATREKEEESIYFCFLKETKNESRKNLMLVQYSTISGVAKESVRNNIIRRFQYVWGLIKAGFSKVIRNFIANGGVTTRKEGDDKEGSVFTCEKRGKSESTAYTDFKEKRSRDWRDSIGRLTALALNFECNQLDDKTKQVYVDKADNNLLRGPFLATAMYYNLRKTN